MVTHDAEVAARSEVVLTMRDGRTDVSVPGASPRGAKEEQAVER